MDEKTISTKRNSRLYAFIALLIICFYLCTELIYDLWYVIAANAAVLLTISFIALGIFQRCFSACREEKIIFAYVVWLFISRFLNGDYFLQRDFAFLVKDVMLSCSFICVGFILDSEDRKKFLNIVCAVVCTYWFILAVVGIYATLNFTRIELFPFSTSVGIGFVTGSYQLTVDNISRNVSGVWFAMAVLLMIYEFFHAKKLIWKFLCIAAGGVFFIATALSFCRAAHIGLCIAISMFFILIALEKARGQSMKKRAVIVIALIFFTLPVTYTAINGVNSLASAVSAQSYERFEAGKKPADSDSKEATPSKEAFSEARDENNYRSFGGRTDVWKAGAISISDEPSRLIYGRLQADYMYDVNELCLAANERLRPPGYSQMHNYLYDSLMLAGIPGLILVLLFSISMVYRMIKVFFSCDRQYSFELKLLTLPISFIFVENMMEASIFRMAIMPSILFFLVCGIFLAQFYEAMSES